MDENQQEVVMSQSAHDALVQKLNAEHQAALTAAVATARADGVTEGGKAAHDRMAAILADDKVKGREAMAMDLALKSPAMKAEDVVAFVAKLPAAGAVPSIAERAQGHGDLGLPAGKPADARAAWAKVTERTNRSRGHAA